MGGQCCECNSHEKEIFTTAEEIYENGDSPTKFRSKRTYILSSQKELKELNSDLKKLLAKKFSKIDSKIKFTAISPSTFDEILNKNPYYKRLINNLKQELSDILYEDDTKYDDIVPIKIIDSYGDVQYYQGSYNILGKCHGPGTWCKQNNIYFGNFYNDEFSGKGVFISSNGNYYFGDWKHNKCNGQGSLVIDGIEAYHGDYKDNKKWGEGIENLSNLDVYFGHFYNDIRKGNGKYIFSDGTAYEGIFNNSKIDGNGKIKFNDGKKFNGEFKDGEINGKGELNYENGIKFKGEFTMNKKNGNGEYIWPDGKKFKGIWKDDIPQGQGTFEDKENKISEVIKYKDGKIIKN